MSTPPAAPPPTPDPATAGRRTSPSTRSLRGFGLGPSMWAFVVLMLMLPVAGYHTLQVHARQEALENARSVSTAMKAMRAYYTRHVVRRILAHPSNVQVTERFLEIPGAIPIPATLSIELGEAIRQDSEGLGFEYVFTSDYPFANRVRRPVDDFEAEALRVFRQGPSGPEGKREAAEFWRIETRANGDDYLRLARPVLMEPGCVACHNAHPDSPVRNWLVGDVRGIEEVSVKMRQDDQADHSTLLVIFLAVFMGTGLLVLREHRTRSARLKALNTEIDGSRRAVESKSQALEASIRDLRTKTTILDRAPFGILMLDPRDAEAGLTFVNDAFCRLTGFAAGEVVGRHPRFLFGPATDRGTREALEQAITRHESCELELTSYRRDGAPLVLRWLVFPSYGTQGELLSTVVCLNDVTQIRQAEAERMRLAGELQESTKLEFLGLTIAGMAHDLNTPIGIAVTASSLMKRQIDQIEQLLADGSPQPEPHKLRTLGERLRSSADMVQKNLSRAAQLVHGFKQTSAEVTRPEWRRVDLRDLIDSLLVTLSPLVRRAGCEVTLSGPPSVPLWTEPSALTQALTNLIVNATIHAFEGRDDRRITVTLRTDTEPQRVIIEVADNGQGMTEEALAKAFTPFYTTRRAAGGSGLGLFSSRRAVEQVLGGTVTVSSSAGAGTRFLITLPAQGKPPSPDAPSHNGREGGPDGN